MNIFEQLLILVRNVQKQKCVKLHLKQLSHSMSVSKINGYACIQGKTSSLATA